MKNVPNLPRVLSSAFLLGGLLAAGMPVEARRQAGGETAVYALRPIYKTGDAARYKFTVRFITERSKQSDLDVSDSRFNMTLLETVKEAAPDGSVTLEDVIEKADGEFDERKMELTAIMPRVTQTLDKSGAATVKLTGGLAEVQAGIKQVFGLLTRTQRSFYPAAPVPTGGTWKIDYQETGENEGKTQGTATLVGSETLDGQATLKIKVDFTSALKVQDLRKGEKIGVSYHFIGTENVDAKTYKLARLQGSSDDILPGGEKAKTEILLTQEIRKEKDKEKAAGAEKSAGLDAPALRENHS